MFRTSQLLWASCVVNILLSWAVISGLLNFNRITINHIALQDRLSTCATALLRAQQHRKTEPCHESAAGVDVQAWQRGMRARGWAAPVVYVGDRHDSTLDTRWTSQVGQDRTIFHLFKGKEGGFFVDLAANDAVVLSNTLTLEQEHGWNGICIEANSKYFEMLYLRRCQVVQAVVGAKDNEKISFNFRDGGTGGVIGDHFDNTGTSGGETKTFSTVSIEHVFQDLSVPAVIDYMSLDIEGAEQWVFETFPWTKYTILALTVERPKELLRHLLVANGYVYVCNHGDFGDQLWLHSTFPSLQNAVASLHLESTFIDKDHPKCRGNWMHGSF